MKLYFVRHGESTANVLGEFSNSGAKHPLTEKGVEQAHSLVLSLTSLLSDSQVGRLSGSPVERIYSSPVLRAMQTAQIIQESLSVRLEISEALREWSVGAYEGTTDPTGWALHRQVQEDWFYHHRLDSKMPGGESFLDIRARFIPFIEKLVKDWGSTDRQFILVAHGGLYLSMLPDIFKNVSYEFALENLFPYTACTIAESRPDGLWCLSWCGVSLEPDINHGFLQ